MSPSPDISIGFSSGTKPGEVELRLLGQPSEPEKQRAGFGAGTLSPSGAALKTINTTFKSAKNLVPSLDELRNSIRDARLERQAQREDRSAALKEARFSLGAQREVPKPVGFAAVFTASDGEEQRAPLLRLGTPGEAGATFELRSTPATPLFKTQNPSGGRLDVNSLDLSI